MSVPLPVCFSIDRTKVVPLLQFSVRVSVMSVTLHMYCSVL